LLSRISKHIAQELGIGPAPHLESLPNLATVRSGYSFKATVDDPEKLAAYGLKGVQRGDKLNVVNLGRNWKVKSSNRRDSVTILVELEQFTQSRLKHK
jgi:hypothetical protein